MSPKDPDDAQTMKDFAKKHGLVTPLEAKATEEGLSDYLHETIIEMQGPLRAHGQSWYLYQNGTWREIEPDLFGALALDVIHPDQRSDRKAEQLVRFLARRLKSEPAPEYATCYKFDPVGRVLLNVANGVLCVSKTEKPKLLPHSPDYNFREQIETAYDYAAECPVFEDALQRAIPDPKDIDVFRKIAGYTLLPSKRFQVVLVMYGPTKTGESEIAQAVAYTLGRSLFTSASLRDLCDSSSQRLVTVEHKALNLAIELDTDEIEQSSIFKLMAEDASLSVRPLYQPKARELSTKCKFWFLTNHQPRFRGGTGAEERRMVFIEFSKVVEKVDPLIEQKLRVERAGILNFMITGLRELFDLNEMPQGGEHSRAAKLSSPESTILSGTL